MWLAPLTSHSQLRNAFLLMYGVAAPTRVEVSVRLLVTARMSRFGGSVAFENDSMPVTSCNWMPASANADWPPGLIALLGATENGRTSSAVLAGQELAKLTPRTNRSLLTGLSRLPAPRPRRPPPPRRGPAR